jgi:glucose/arabinose dehydrogenase
MAADGTVCVEDRGEVRLFATGDGAKPGPGRLLASRLEGPTGVARLPDGRLVVAGTGHHGLRVLPADRSFRPAGAAAPAPTRLRPRPGTMAG